MTEQTDNKKSLQPSKSVWRALRRPILSGLAIVVPVGVTIFTLKLLYDFTAGHLAPVIKPFIDPMPDYVTPVAACILLVMLVYGVGMVAGVVLGKKAISLMESLIHRIPYVKFIYSASKQIVQSLFIKGKRNEPKIPVVIEFPRPGLKSLGFVVGSVALQDGRIFYRVFVPTTPNITVGLLQFVAPEDVYGCPLTLDDAVKMVVSLGILGPDHMILDRASTTPLQSSQSAEEDDAWEDDEDEF